MPKPHQFTLAAAVIVVYLAGVARGRSSKSAVSPRPQEPKILATVAESEPARSDEGVGTNPARWISSSGPADWVQAFGTILAAVLALWAGSIALEGLSEQRRINGSQVAINESQLQLNERAEENYSARYAMRVSHWWKVEGNGKSPNVTLVVDNQSSLPITQVMLQLNLQGRWVFGYEPDISSFRGNIVNFNLTNQIPPCATATFQLEPFSYRGKPFDQQWWNRMQDNSWAFMFTQGGVDWSAGNGERLIPGRRLYPVEYFDELKRTPPTLQSSKNCVEAG